ncbi:MAG TPA: HAMP domain-containing sensor histidine kinase [Pseudonocardiaceae bacterium]|nr:HAMP domain-containing sensor histidine kinase [Pseudonocardiaceae bacterium]
MRWRILQSTLIAVAITGLVLGGPLAFASWRLVEHATRANLLARLAQVVVRLDDPSSPTTPNPWTPLGSIARALPPGGQLVVDSPRTGHSVIGADPGPGAVVESLALGPRGTVRLAVPGGGMRGDQLRAVAVVALLVGLSVGIGAAVATVTARRLAGPLEDVADRATRLGMGDFRPAPARHGIPELDRVADLLDTSAAALAELIARERDLVGDVSHQLRSRLTALLLRLDELAAHPDPDTAAEAEAALEQAERLGAVLDDLLRATEEARAATAEPVELAALLGEVVADWQPQADADRRPLRLRVADALVARVTPGRLREALGVLIDNALRHGAGVVTLSARWTGVGPDRMVVVEVTDGGEGVPEDLAARVFDRGISGASSTGVGLALARALVEADGGRLELSSARPARFAVYLRVPRGEELPGPARPGAGVVR